MAIDRRAEAYAEQFYQLFLARYIDAAKAGRSDIIPQPIRDAVTSYATGRQPQSQVNPGKWMKQALYEHRVRTGGDYPLPPEFGKSSSNPVATGAAVGAAVGLGLAKTLFRLLR